MYDRILNWKWLWLHLVDFYTLEIECHQWFEATSKLIWILYGTISSCVNIGIDWSEHGFALRSPTSGTDSSDQYVILYPEGEHSVDFKFTDLNFYGFHITQITVEKIKKKQKRKDLREAYTKTTVKIAYDVRTHSSKEQGKWL